MNIDSDKLGAFYQLSKDKSFSKAAISLGISQPGLSKKIAKLEDELESNLVIRGTKQVSFTAAGMELIKYFRMKMDLDSQLLDKLSYNKTKGLLGEVNIATYSSIGRSIILPRLAKLPLEYPKLRINFLIKEIRDLEKALLSGEVNFIITTHLIDRENVICIQVGEEEEVHIVPKNIKVPNVFLDHDEYDQTTYDFLKRQGKPTKIMRNYFDDIYGIIDAVKSGYGQAVVSKHLVHFDKSLKIKSYKKKVKKTVYLCYFNRSYYPIVHKEIIKLIKKLPL